VQVKGSRILNDSLLMLDAALDGAGVVYSTEDAIRDNVRSGNLEIVLDQFACTSTGFCLYYPKRSQVLPKLRGFIEHIKSENKVVPRQARYLKMGNPTKGIG
jgi:DNA-binding transcriptional LysR family regulator